jgi:hypothetical protein
MSKMLDQLAMSLAGVTSRRKVLKYLAGALFLGGAGCFPPRDFCGFFCSTCNGSGYWSCHDACVDCQNKGGDICFKSCMQIACCGVDTDKSKATCCSGQCTDTTSDPYNCGGCSNSSAGTTASGCLGGYCVGTSTPNCVNSVCTA